MNKISYKILIVALVLTIIYMSGDAIIRKIFYPPSFDMSVGPGEDTPGKTFTHEAYATLLRKHVSDQGLVHYNGFKKSQKELAGYLNSVSQAKVPDLSKYEQIAFYINAYNALTIQLILENEGVKSIREIPSGKRWKGKTWSVAGANVTLDDIEHAILRKTYKENKIHFALVCASKGCPPLARVPYTGKNLQDLLKKQTMLFLRNPENLQFDEQTAILRISSIFDWYRNDFGSEEQTLLFLANHAEPSTGKKIRNRYWKIRYLKYNWALNSTLL